MRHIYIIDEHQSSKQNGIGTYISQLLKCFEDCIYNVTLLSFNADEREFSTNKHATYTEYHVPTCGKNGFLNNGALSLSLLRLYIDDSRDNIFFVNHFPCDRFLHVLKKLFPLSYTIFVIHDQGWCAPLLGDADMFRKVLTGTYCPKKNKQIWQHIRNLTTREKCLYRKADKIVALSFTTYKLLQELYDVPASKIHLIPNGLQAPSITRDSDSSMLRKEYGIGEDEIILLYTGRTSPSKGIIPMLEAFELAWREEHKLRLVIAGGVYTFNEFAKHTPTSAMHITYTGLLAKDQLSRLYKMADIGILPSYTEQSSYTGIEMLAYGKLVITTDGHNLTDMFSDGTAIIAHIGENRTKGQAEFVASLRTAITAALTLSEDSKSKIRNQAHQHYENSFSFHNWKASYTRLISE